MPSDNLEKYIKEKLAAVQHTPPPGSNWDPEAAWLKLQQPPVLTRHKKTSWFSYATAAVLVLALLAGLMRQYFVSKQATTETRVATTPAKETEKATGPSKTTTEKLVKHPAGNITPAVKPHELPPKLALGKKLQHSVKLPFVSVAGPKAAKAPITAPASIPDAPPAETVTGPDAKATPEAETLAATTPPPLKITVVLGNTSTANMLNQTTTNLPAKRRKTRLRLNVPVPEYTDKGHFASTDSSYQPLKLQARIDL